MFDVVGWDIGGAHLKAAHCAGGRLQRVRQLPTPLWLGLQHLDDAAAAVLDALPRAPALHAVTMTGELADLFPDRRRGVCGIADAFAAQLARRRPNDRLRFFAGDAGLLPHAEVAAAHRAIASANWLASAAWCAAAIGDGVLVDIGSTTTDIVPFAGGRIRAVGSSDAERLETGELVYLGMLRTPLMALAQRVPFGGLLRRPMNECFATTADVMRVCGELDEATDMLPAADQGEKSVAASARRLLRMVAEDLPDAGLARARELARWYRARLIDELHGALDEVLQRGAAAPQAPLVAAGIGAPLVAELAARVRRPLLRWEELPGMDVATPEARAWSARCAPAVAVARLAAAQASMEGLPLCIRGNKGDLQP